MDVILSGYSVNEPTWFYLSLLLIIAVFFRFTRLWSLRNLDLVLLLSISPGLLLVDESSLGYVWLFVGTGLFLTRLFCDSLFIRRPLLEQNLNVHGLGFLCVAVFAFQMTNVMTEPPPTDSVETVHRGDQLLKRADTSDSNNSSQAGPTSTALAASLVPIAKTVEAVQFEYLAARIMAIVAHLAVIFGLIFVGHRHFGDAQNGIAMATLYLLLPCTAYDVGTVNHVLPAALIVWAFVAYRRPMIAGTLMGLACGALFFPIFLLPLWAAFYGRRVALRFALAVGIVGTVLLGTLILTSVDTHSFTRQTIGSIDWTVLSFRGTEAEGFWSTHDVAYRLPVVVSFFVLMVVLAIFPLRKNLEHLMSHSAAIVVATQLWYPIQGGVYLLWYLPLLLMVIFRPRLTHHLPPPPTARAETDRQASAPIRTEVAASAPIVGRQFR